MSIPVSVSGAASTAASAQDGVKARADAPSAASAGAKAKAQLNVSIVQASLTVSLSSNNEPLALLYKSAITSINEALKAQFGDDAIEHAVSADNTPEGTAGRIVALSTAFYDAFKAQHKGEDEADVLKNFLDTLRGGVEQGFKEARGILDGLGVLGGSIAGNIDKTYDLVQQGYADFAAAHAPPAPEPA